MSEREMLIRAKRAILGRETVNYRHGGNTEYLPLNLIWGTNKGAEYYSVRLVDPSARSSSVDVRLHDVIFKE